MCRESLLRGRDDALCACCRVSQLITGGLTSHWPNLTKQLIHSKIFNPLWRVVQRFQKALPTCPFLCLTTSYRMRLTDGGVVGFMEYLHFTWHSPPLYIEMACNGVFGAGEATQIAPPNLTKQFTLSKAELVVEDSLVRQLILDIEVLIDLVKVRWRCYSSALLWLYSYSGYPYEAGKFSVMG